jgi:ABC-type lipoprotein export system ATPase subunit
MLIKASNIEKIVCGPDDKDINILKNIDLEVKKSEFLVILGPSGSGKTTLLQILGLMDTPTVGTLSIFEKNIESLNTAQKARIRAAEIGFMFQKPLLIGDLTLLENIKLASSTAKKKITNNDIEKLLDKVGLKSKKNYYPSMLSAGEAQRGALARAMVNQPSLIIADEPTSNLDKENKLIVLENLRQFNKENKTTIVLATHDELVLSYSKRYVKLIDGSILSES